MQKFNSTKRSFLSAFIGLAVLAGCGESDTALDANVDQIETSETATQANESELEAPDTLEQDENDRSATTALEENLDAPPLTPTSLPTCSATDVDLPPAARQETGDETIDDTVREIIQLAANCDIPGLVALTDADFNASFGGDSPATLWPNEEAAGRAPLAAMIEVLGTLPAVDANGLATWPSFFTTFQCGDKPSVDEEVDMDRVGFDPTTDCVDGGLDTYGGYRIGVDSSGKWLFFVQGD